MWVDTEMRLTIQPEGHLEFVETAVQGFNGGELRAPDRAFGMIFAQNLLEQGFGEAISKAYLTQLGQEAMAEPGLESAAQKPLPPEPLSPIEALFQQRPDLFHEFDRAEFEALASGSPELLYQDGERGFLWLEGHDNPYAYQQDAMRDALAGASMPHLASAHDPQVTPETTLAGAVGAKDLRSAQNIYGELGLVVQPLYPQSSQDSLVSSPSPQPDPSTDVDEALLLDLGPGPHHPPPLVVEVPTGSPGLEAIDRGGAVLTFEAGERLWELQLSQDELAMVNASMRNAKAVVRERGTEVGAQWMERAANTIATKALGDEHGDPVTIRGAVGQLMAEFYTSLDTGVNPAIQSAAPSERQADSGGVDSPPTTPITEQSSVAALSESSPVALAEPVQSQALLKDLREWYFQARALGRSPSHLGRIEQIGQAINSGHEGAYGDVDRITRQHDQKAYLQQAANVLAQSKYLLARLGQEQPDGSKVFAGKTYTLLSQGDEIAVLAIERGEIFNAKGSRVLHSQGLSAEDAHKFSAQVSRVRQALAAQTTPHPAAIPAVYDR